MSNNKWSKLKHNLYGISGIFGVHIRKIEMD